MIAALLLSLSLHHHGKPLANIVRCTPSQCVKIPVWKARHAETGHRVKHAIRRIHGRWVHVTLRFPILREPAKPVSYGTFFVTGYSWGCGTPNGITAAGTVPQLGTISNDFLPFGTHVDVPALHYRGTVLDRGVATGGFDLFVNSCQGFPTGWYRVEWS